MGNSCRKAVNNYVSLSEEATKLRNGLDSPKYNQFANEKRKYNKNDHIMLPRNKSIKGCAAYIWQLPPATQMT